LFLDEPTIGLDVAMQLAVREFIRAYNERNGATVLLTSHDMDDVSSLCSRVIVIDKGELRYDGDLGALARTIRTDKRIVLRFTTPPDRAGLERMGTVVEFEDGRATLQVAQAELRAAVSYLLGQASVQDLTVEDPPLEEIMRDLFSTPKAEQAGP